LYTWQSSYKSLSFSVHIVYWSWNGGPREGRGVEALEKGGQISGGGGAGGGWDSIFENDQSAKVNNIELGMDLFKASTSITGAEWPDLSVARSPCPTLNVIGAISKGMIEKEELKRMVERPGFDAQGKPLQLTKRKKVKLIAQKVTGGILRRTVGRVGRFLGKRLLGRVPETALEGSFQEELPEVDKLLLAKEEIAVEVVAPAVEPTFSSETSSLEDKDLADEISTQVFGEYEASKQESNDSKMKSDQELIEELMTGKEKKETIA
jgi:hypothetical protein